MSHGIDVCRCGAVVMQCRCMGPHTKRVVCETCDACRSKPAPQPTTPTPTTASLHREMVEALRDACYGRSFDLYRARAALEGWEKKPRLRDQPELRAVIVAALASSSEERVYVPAILDALEPLLYGERG